MNKLSKIFMLSAILVSISITGLNQTYASNNHETKIKQPRQEFVKNLRAERKETVREIRNTRANLNEDINSLKKNFRSAFQNLSSETKEQVKAIHETYKEQRGEIRDEYQNKFADEFVEAMINSYQNEANDILTIIPEDQKELRESLLNQQTESWTQYFQERSNSLYQKYSKSTQKFLDRVNNVLDKLEKIGNTDKLIELYNNVINRVNNVITKLENNTRIPTDLLNSKIEAYESLVATIQDRIDSLSNGSIGDEAIDVDSDNND